MNGDGGHTQLPGNGRPSGADVLVVAAEHKGSTALIYHSALLHTILNQFYPPPILTTISLRSISLIN